MQKKIKIIYIAGMQRSGSTILGSILGQIKGFFFTGELQLIWRMGLIGDSLCSCGYPVKACKVWEKILDQAFGGLHQINPERLHRLLNNGLRTRHLLITPSSKSYKARISKMEEYPMAVERLYHAIHYINGGGVIVDSSKAPNYGYVLETIPSIDVYFIHLVRDPRAVAYSLWGRRKVTMDSDGIRYLPRMNPAKTSFQWSGKNFVIGRTLGSNSDHYILVRYEDFAKDPQKSIHEILNLVHEEKSHLPFVSRREVELSTQHTPFGNPNRFRTGRIPSKLDEEWKKKRTLQQTFITIMTLPGLIKYGYLPSTPKNT